MSFQAYLDNVKAKTGKTPADFKRLAEKQGLTKHGDLVAWLKSEFALGHGHANAVTAVILRGDQPRPSDDAQIDRHFAGARERWRKTYDKLLAATRKFGDDVRPDPTSSYISLLRGEKKFAIVQVTSDHLDVGIKRKGTPTTDRFADAGKWNAMVTHRVRLADPKQLDPELISWLKEAHARA